MVSSSSSSSSSSFSRGAGQHKNEGWGMGMGMGLGLLFIFFHNNNNDYPDDDTNTITRKPISSSSSSNLLLSKTQSTLSICALLLFTTLLLFTLSTFEPTANAAATITSTSTNPHPHAHARGALHGIGDLYLRGTKPMPDLIVAHLSEEASPNQLRTFIRLILHSALLSRSDLVLLFPSPSLSAQFRPTVRSECDSLIRLVRLGTFESALARYFRPVGDGGKEPLWGKTRNSTSMLDSTRPSYGSVVGFEASELDPEDALSGFLDHVPMSLRRWACYPMLLGRLRRNFKHMMLVDAGNTLLLSDPFTRVRNRSSESIFLWSNSVSATRRGRRNSGKPHASEPGVLIGGSRGVRRFANAALTEIVRASMDEHKYKGKKRETVSESGVVNQVVHSGHLMKTIKLITPSESIPEFNSGSGLIGMSDYVSVVKRGQSVDLDETVMREICGSHKSLVSVYTDCFSKTIT